MNPLLLIGGVATAVTLLIKMTKDPEEPIQHVVFNRKPGGLKLTHEAILKYCELAGITVYPTVKSDRDVEASSDVTYYLLDPRHTTKAAKDALHRDVVFDPTEIYRADPLLLKALEIVPTSTKHGYNVAKVPGGLKWHIQTRSEDYSELVVEDAKEWR